MRLSWFTGACSAAGLDFCRIRPAHSIYTGSRLSTRAHQAASGYTTHAPQLQRCEPTNKIQHGAPVLAKLHGSIAPEKCSEGGWQFTALQYRGRKAPSGPSNARFYERAVSLQSSSTAVRCPRPRSHRPAVSPFLVRTAAAKPRAPSCSCHSFKWYMLQRQQAPLGAGSG